MRFKAVAIVSIAVYLFALLAVLCRNYRGVGVYLGPNIQSMHSTYRGEGGLCESNKVMLL
jgi:hypothetical protein